MSAAFEPGDRMEVSVGTAGSSAQATVDLSTGECTGQCVSYVSHPDGTRSWSRQSAEFVWDAATLAQIRTEARDLHAGSDREFRDQFAQATVRFDVSLGGTAVCVVDHCDGAAYKEDLLRLVLGPIWAAEKHPHEP